MQGLPGPAVSIPPPPPASSSSPPPPNYLSLLAVEVHPGVSSVCLLATSGSSLCCFCHSQGPNGEFGPAGVNGPAGPRVSSPEISGLSGGWM